MSTSSSSRPFDGGDDVGPDGYELHRADRGDPSGEDEDEDDTDDSQEKEKEKEKEKNIVLLRRLLRYGSRPSDPKAGGGITKREILGELKRRAGDSGLVDGAGVRSTAGGGSWSSPLSAWALSSKAHLAERLRVVLEEELVDRHPRELSRLRSKQLDLLLQDSNGRLDDDDGYDLQGLRAKLRIRNVAFPTPTDGADGNDCNRNLIILKDRLRTALEGEKRTFDERAAGSAATASRRHPCNGREEEDEEEKIGTNGGGTSCRNVFGMQVEGQGDEDDDDVEEGEDNSKYSIDSADAATAVAGAGASVATVPLKKRKLGTTLAAAATAAAATSSSSPRLTDEQRVRVERNRRRAYELQRQRRGNTTLSQQQPPPPPPATRTHPTRAKDPIGQSLYAIAQQSSTNLKDPPPPPPVLVSPPAAAGNGAAVVPAVVTRPVRAAAAVIAAPKGPANASRKAPRLSANRSAAAEEDERQNTLSVVDQPTKNKENSTNLVSPPRRARRDGESRQGEGTERMEEEGQEPPRRGVGGGEGIFVDHDRRTRNNRMPVPNPPPPRPPPIMPASPSGSEETARRSNVTTAATGGSSKINSKSRPTKKPQNPPPARDGSVPISSAKTLKKQAPVTTPMVLGHPSHQHAPLGRHPTPSSSSFSTPYVDHPPNNRPCTGGSYYLSNGTMAGPPPTSHSQYPPPYSQRPPFPPPKTPYPYHPSYSSYPYYYGSRAGGAEPTTPMTPSEPSTLATYPRRPVPAVEARQLDFNPDVPMECPCARCGSSDPAALCIVWKHAGERRRERVPPSGYEQERWDCCGRLDPQPCFVGVHGPTSLRRAYVPVLCHCRRPASLRRTRKPGDNTGRYYFSCNAHYDCHYFQWADAALGLPWTRRIVETSSEGGTTSYSPPSPQGEGMVVEEWLYPHVNPFSEIGLGKSSSSGSAGPQEMARGRVVAALMVHEMCCIATGHAGRTMLSNVSMHDIFQATHRIFAANTFAANDPDANRPNELLLQNLHPLTRTQIALRFNLQNEIEDIVPPTDEECRNILNMVLKRNKILRQVGVKKTMSYYLDLTGLRTYLII